MRARRGKCPLRFSLRRSLIASLTLIAILYEFVRDLHHGKNIALLTAKAFSAREPAERQTWRIRLSPAGECEFPKMRIGFARSDFGNDARIAR
ncbi:hypothetical protein ACVJBD_002889 [Rhizobium mongolense]